MFERIVLSIALAAGLAQAQERKTRIDVENYAIDVDINQRTQSLSAKAAVRFTPLDDNTTSVPFELNNALNVSKVVDQQNSPLQASRSQQDFTINLNFSPPLVKGKPVTITFYYDGRLSGQEDSPVYGIKFAAIQNDYAYLMYPARWFPISGYSTDRYSAEINVSVAKGFKALGSGVDTAQSSADKTTYNFKFERASFPGSIAVVKDAPATRVSSEGVTTALYFRPAEQPMTNAYGQETGKIVTHFTGLFGLAPYANLTIVETEAAAPNGYSAPGLLFLNPRAIGQEVNTKLLGNQI